MLRGYPSGGCGMPAILMPAPCVTLMGCPVGFMGGPAKPPPRDAISGIHKWSSRRSDCLQASNKVRSHSHCQSKAVLQWRESASYLTSESGFRASKLGLRFDRKRKKPTVKQRNKQTNKQKLPGDSRLRPFRSPGAFEFPGFCFASWLWSLVFDANKPPRPGCCSSAPPRRPPLRYRHRLRFLRRFTPV